MRKLAIAAFYFAAAIFISRYLLPFNWQLISSAAAVVVSFFCLLFSGNMRIRIFIAFLSMAVGFLWSWTYTSVFIKPYWEQHDDIVTITSVVIDYPVLRQSHGYRVDASIQQDGYPSIGVRIYYYNESDLKPGDIIETTAHLRRTDITDDGDRFDALSSRGIFLSAFVSGNIEVVDSQNSFRYIPKRIAERIAEKASEIFPEDISHFMQALLSSACIK